MLNLRLRVRNRVPSEDYYALPSERVTVWDPGVPDGIPNYTNIHSTILASTYGNGSQNASVGIQAAIDAAGAVAGPSSPQVVKLSAGTFRIDYRLNLDSNYVVLRGDGTNIGGAGGGTRLIFNTVDEDFLHFGFQQDVSGQTSYALTANAAQGASTFAVASGHGMQAGDMILIDKVDDAQVVVEGGTWWKRGPGNGEWGVSSSLRGRGQICEVESVNGNNITIVGRLHAPYPTNLTSQILRGPDRRAGWVGMGLEDMTITGWGDAYGVTFYWCKKCWVKNVEFDGQPTAQGGVGTGTLGVDLRIHRSCRVQVEHCYLHHSRGYPTNNRAYSISIASQSSDCYIVDNIVFRKNKNVTLEASGSGNVIAYNYLDDPVIAPDGDPDAIQTDWFEMCCDGTHISFPCYDLFEGNYVAKMGAAETHGNAGQQTFFRCYSKGDRIYTINHNAGLCAVMFNRYMRQMSVVGCVLDTHHDGGIYEPTWTADWMPAGQMNAPKIWSIGLDGYDGNWQGPRDPSVQQNLIRDANYDYIRNQVDNTPADPLPNSLYLTEKPAFFGAYTWPWVDSLGSTKLYTLPAKARFDSY